MGGSKSIKQGARNEIMKINLSFVFYRNKGCQKELVGEQNHIGKTIISERARNLYKLTF